MELNSVNKTERVNAKYPNSEVILSSEMVLTKTRCQNLDAVKRLNCWYLLYFVIFQKKWLVYF